MYTQLSIEECINLVIDFIARDHPIPHELRINIGPILMHELEHPLKEDQ